MGLEELLQPAATGPAVLLATALLLGALHGLEPGHSKTMMAAFVVAVRGTPRQAALLGVSAAASHTLLVWVLALLGLAFGGALIGVAAEPWVAMASGAIVFAAGALALSRAAAAGGHDAAGEDAHGRAHADDIRSRFVAGRATTRQVVLFGLAGGLAPCSAAVGVLMICLQQQQVLLGIGLVAAFTLGLAGILVASGLVAATGMRAAAGSGRFDHILHHAPLASGTILVVLGLVMIDDGLAVLGL